jgi:UDP-N-acetylglucosamine 4,6-dehydratase
MKYRMQGGELFVPKIPSVRIVDLARAMAPELPQHVIGIRPGEKLHEMMITRDDSINTVVFDDHYVITPSVRFVVQSDYATNGRGEVGKRAEEGFKYTSDNNGHFLTIDELRALDKQTV